MMAADDAWDAQKDDVFNVVADIEVPSERIRYAFLAGYCVAEGTALSVEPTDEADDVRAAVDRLLNEVQIHVAEYGDDAESPGLNHDISVVARFALAQLTAQASDGAGERFDE